MLPLELLDNLVLDLRKVIGEKEWDIVKESVSLLRISIILDERRQTRDIQTISDLTEQCKKLRRAGPLFDPGQIL